MYDEAIFPEEHIFSGLRKNYYNTVLSDPPWRFKTYNEKGRQRSPDWKPFKDSLSKHYDTMETEAIAALPVAELCAPDAVLFLWICWPMLPDALALVEAWGFTYKSCAFSWMKAHAGQMDLYAEAIPVQVGMGYWTRSNSEVCLLATRGKPKRRSGNVRQGIIEPRREHSRKPSCVHERIEHLVGGPYIELFARSTRKNWTSWGLETGKFVEVV